MALGNPDYNYGDVVNFKIMDSEFGEMEICGVIEIVDAYGVFEDDSQAYYDIMVKPDARFGENGCLYKHIPESNVWSEG